MREELQYVVLQVTLKEALIGTGSANLVELERVINNQAAKGYRLHTISTASGGSKGFAGGDRIQATMVFERIADTGSHNKENGNSTFTAKKYDSSPSSTSKSNSGYSLSKLANERANNEFWVCKDCGTKNDIGNLYCKDCGKYK